MSYSGSRERVSMTDDSSTVEAPPSKKQRTSQITSSPHSTSSSPSTDTHTTRLDDQDSIQLSSDEPSTMLVSSNDKVDEVNSSPMTVETGLSTTSSPSPSSSSASTGVTTTSTTATEKVPGRTVTLTSSSSAPSSSSLSTVSFQDDKVATSSTSSAFPRKTTGVKRRRSSDDDARDDGKTTTQTTTSSTRATTTTKSDMDSSMSSSATASTSITVTTSSPSQSSVEPSSSRKTPTSSRLKRSSLSSSRSSMLTTLALVQDPTQLPVPESWRTYRASLISAILSVSESPDPPPSRPPITPSSKGPPPHDSVAAATVAATTSNTTESTNATNATDATTTTTTTTTANTTTTATEPVQQEPSTSSQQEQAPGESHPPGHELTSSDSNVLAQDESGSPVSSPILPWSPSPTSSVYSDGSETVLPAAETPAWGFPSPFPGLRLEAVVQEEQGAPSPQRRRPATRSQPRPPPPGGQHLLDYKAAFSYGSQPGVDVLVGPAYDIAARKEARRIAMFKRISQDRGMYQLLADSFDDFNNLPAFNSASSMVLQGTDPSAMEEDGTPDPDNEAGPADQATDEFGFPPREVFPNAEELMEETGVAPIQGIFIHHPSLGLFVLDLGTAPPLPTDTSVVGTAADKHEASTYVNDVLLTPLVPRQLFNGDRLTFGTTGPVWMVAGLRGPEWLARYHPESGVLDTAGLSRAESDEITSHLTRINSSASYTIPGLEADYPEVTDPSSVPSKRSSFMFQAPTMPYCRLTQESVKTVRAPEPASPSTLQFKTPLISSLFEYDKSQPANPEIVLPPKQKSRKKKKKMARRARALAEALQSGAIANGLMNDDGSMISDEPNTTTDPLEKVLEELTNHEESERRSDPFLASVSEEAELMSPGSSGASSSGSEGSSSSGTSSPASSSSSSEDEIDVDYVAPDSKGLMNQLLAQGLVEEEDDDEDYEDGADDGDDGGQLDHDDHDRPSISALLQSRESSAASSSANPSNASIFVVPKQQPPPPQE